MLGLGIQSGGWTPHAATTARPARGVDSEDVMAKRFFYVCFGIFCLALAYHLGASRATAQGTRGQIKFVEARGTYVVVVSEADEIFVIDPEKLPNVAKGTGWWKFRLDAVK